MKRRMVLACAAVLAGWIVSFAVARWLLGAPLEISAQAARLMLRDPWFLAVGAVSISPVLWALRRGTITDK